VNGTTMVTGLVGKVWAAAVVAPSASTHAASALNTVFMKVSLIVLRQALRPASGAF
jgi:hypothetical protein